jgi:hypothetical protein
MLLTPSINRVLRPPLSLWLSHPGLTLSTAKHSDPRSKSSDISFNWMIMLSVASEQGKDILHAQFANGLATTLYRCVSQRTLGFLKV